MGRHLRIETLLQEGKSRELRESIKYEELSPPDMDESLLRRAEEIFHSHFFSLMASMLSGLLTLMYVPSIATILKATTETTTPVGAFRRYLSTVNHIIMWHQDEKARETSLNRVRKYHAHSARVSVEKGGKSISQYDMVVTQWAFIGPALLFPERSGLSEVGEEDLMALAHLMHFVGWVLGVDEDLNLCTGSFEEIHQYCQDIHQRIILPYLNQSPPTELSQYMSRHMLEGAAMILPMIHFGAFKAWTFERLEVSEKRLNEVVSGITHWHEWIIYHITVFVFEKLMVWSWTRWPVTFVLGHLMRLNIFLAKQLQTNTIRSHKKREIRKKRRWARFQIEFY